MENLRVQLHPHTPNSILSLVNINVFYLYCIKITIFPILLSFLFYCMFSYIFQTWFWSVLSVRFKYCDEAISLVDHHVCSLSLSQHLKLANWPQFSNGEHLGILWNQTECLQWQMAKAETNERGDILTLLKDTEKMQTVFYIKLQMVFQGLIWVNPLTTQ